MFVNFEFIFCVFRRTSIDKNFFSELFTSLKNSLNRDKYKFFLRMECCHSLSTHNKHCENANLSDKLEL